MKRAVEDPLVEMRVPLFKMNELRGGLHRDRDYDTSPQNGIF